MKSICLIILSTLTFISCSKKSDLILIGNINNKVNGKIVLTKKGNILEGTFFNLDNEKKIKLIGTIVKNKIDLQEYSQGNTLSGFFEGTLNNSVFKGMWLNESKKKKVPFHFLLKENLNDKNRFDLNTKVSNLEEAYSKWYIQKTEIDYEFEKLKDCNDKNGYWETGNERNTKYGTLIPEKIDFIKGNINNDGYIDAVANIDSPFCGGNRSKAICLIFISNTKGEYDIFYNSNLEFEYETELDTIINNTIKGNHFEHGNFNNHRTSVRPININYSNGKFDFNYGIFKAVN